MAFNPRDYPDDWQAIRAAVRQRSGNRCEGCHLHPDCRAENGKPHPITGSKVVLTVAHLNHRKKDGRLEVLRHLCPRCHLAIDRPHHLRVQAENRLKRRYQAQPPLPFDQKEPEVWRPIDRKALAFGRGKGYSDEDR